jgi:hypothetical protein
MANSVSSNNTYPVAQYSPAEPEDPADDGGSGLSPDALMAYCESRLDSIDTQVTASFTDQQKNASAISQIDQTIAALKPFDSSNQTDPAVCKQLESTLGGLINSLKSSDPGCPALPALTTTYNSMVWSGDGGRAFKQSVDPSDPDFIDKAKYPPTTAGPQGDNVLNSTELQGYVQSLSDAASSLDSNSELQMVQLQSLMSQRQTAISLTTNLVQSLGDQENKIADNIGH